jgi:transcriptional regulator with XRE-family HTH domain
MDGHPNGEPVSLPSTLRAARERHGLSREGLAFKAGVSIKTIERAEFGVGIPRRATQKVIADVLGCEPDDLFEIKEAA